MKRSKEREKKAALRKRQVEAENSQESKRRKLNDLQRKREMRERKSSKEKRVQAEKDLQRMKEMREKKSSEEKRVQAEKDLQRKKEMRENKSSEEKKKKRKGIERKLMKIKRKTPNLKVWQGDSILTSLISMT